MFSYTKCGQNEAEGASVSLAIRLACIIISIYTLLLLVTGFHIYKLHVQGYGALWQLNSLCAAGRVT